jgi:hypothetical protein
MYFNPPEQNNTHNRSGGSFLLVLKDTHNPPQIKIGQASFPALFHVKIGFFHNRLGYVLTPFTDHKSRHPYDPGYPSLPVVFPDCRFPYQLPFFLFRLPGSLVGYFLYVLIA